MPSRPSREDLIRAVDLAIAGDWTGAHEIVQQDDTDPVVCWVHAVLHKIEGDAANARYWYRRSGQAYEAWPDPKAELAAIKAVLTY
jgi:hypothetical protein